MFRTTRVKPAILIAGLARTSEHTPSSIDFYLLSITASRKIRGKKMDLLEIDLEKKTGVHIVFDYFSATFPFVCYEDDSEYQIINEIVLMICDFLNIKKEDISKENYAMHRFEFQYKLLDHIILRLCGPELKSGHKSCSIELSGQGCREFEEIAESKTWIDFLEFFIVRLNASPTRIDIALDDYDGNIITFDEIKRKMYL